MDGQQKLKLNIYYYYAPVKSHQRSHHPLIFNVLSLISNFFVHFNLLTYCYTFSNFSPPFYTFISLLLSILISLFLYLFIFLYFWLFLFLSFYYKFAILYLILYIIFPHTTNYFSLPNFFFSFLVDSIFLASISTLGC